MRARHRRRGVTLLGGAFAAWLCASGCGSDGTSTPDGATAIDGGPAVSVTPPDIPWLGAGAPPVAAPGLTPCPDGWREVPSTPDGDPATCDPYPMTGALDCPDGQAHFPGEPGCVSVGAACPPGEFADGLPSDRRVVYVRPGSIGGDGTTASPYGSLAEFSLGALARSSVIALSTGAHDGPVRLARQHVLRGACAEATLLGTRLPDTTEGVVTMLGEGGAVQDLTISDSPRRGVRLAGRGVEGRLDGVVIRAVEALAVDVTFGSRLSAETVAVFATAGRATDGAFGRGLSVELGATGDVSRAVLSRNRDLGVFVNEADSTLTLSDASVRDTEGRQSDGRWGAGLDLRREATARVSRTQFSHNHRAGVEADGAGTALVLSDVVISDTRGQASDESFGRGLVVAAEASAEVQRTVLSRNRDIGLVASGTGTAVVLSDLMVRDTRARMSDDLFGRGVGVELGAVGEVSRLWLSRNRETAMLSGGEGAAIMVSDLVARDTDGQASDGTGGVGLRVQVAGMAEVRSALVHGNLEVGVAVTNEGTAVTLSDLVVRGTESRTSDGTGGRALSVASGAVVNVSRALFSENREAALIAQEGGRADLDNGVISDTRPRSCALTTCADFGAGHGVGSYHPGTRVRVTRFAIRDSALCGVHVAEGAELDLDDGEVRGQPIGACVQVDGYDTTRLTASVHYGDNGVNLESTSLPVPEAGVGF